MAPKPFTNTAPDIPLVSQAYRGADPTAVNRDVAPDGSEQPQPDYDPDDIMDGGS